MRDDRYEEAWALSERALAERDRLMGRVDPSVPFHLRSVWDGKAFDGKDVLVRCYHGLGDTIQFARYLPRLAKRAGSVSVEVQPRLLCLLANVPGIDRLIPFDPANPAPESQCDLEITELAFALRDPPLQVQPPYLSATPASLPAGTIGLCYGAGDWDRDRCIPPDWFRTICARYRSLTLVPEPNDLPFINPEGCPFDMTTTASLVAAVDLVISVDTMIAHLAGAMAKPTWLLLKADPDWRWSPHRSGSAWYPSMRLYRQVEPGDWRTPLDQVERDLGDMGFAVPMRIEP